VVAMKMEVIRSSETSVHTRSTRRHIPKDGIVYISYKSPTIQVEVFWCVTQCSSEDGGNKFLGNIGTITANCIAPHLRRS
jgi:hypothetical protein